MVSTLQQLLIGAIQESRKQLGQLPVEKYPSQEIKEYTFKPIISESGSPVLGVYLGKSMVLHYDTKYERLFVVLSIQFSYTSIFGFR